MTERLAGIVFIAVWVGLTATCAVFFRQALDDIREQARQKAEAPWDGLRYFRDPRTGACFAMLDEALTVVDCNLMKAGSR